MSVGSSPDLLPRDSLSQNPTHQVLSDQNTEVFKGRYCQLTINKNLILYFTLQVVRPVSVEEQSHQCLPFSQPVREHPTITPGYCSGGGDGGHHGGECRGSKIEVLGE